MGSPKVLRRRVFPNACLLALWASAALGSPPQHPAGAERWARLAERTFRPVGRTDEAPSSSWPTTLTQDAEGFTWIGTQNGLARWDGYRFRIYTPGPASDGALPAGFISRALTDSRGRLWIGTTSGGLALYDPARDRFVRYGAGTYGLSSVHVLDITDDGAGGVWVATPGGLDHVRPESDRVSHLRHNEGDPGSLPDDNIYAVLRTRDGSLWVGTGAGLVRQTPGEKSFAPIALPAPDRTVAQVSTLSEDAQQRLWVGTNNHGAYLVDPRDMRARQILKGGPQRGTLRANAVRAIAEVRAGEVWIGTFNQGIFAVDTANFHIRRIRHEPLSHNSLPDDRVTALYKDLSGLVWVSTLHSLSLYDPSQDAVYTIAGASGHHNGLTDEDVSAVLQMPDNRLWLGLARNGIDVLDALGARTGGLRPHPRRPLSALPASPVYDLAPAASGDVYAGTFQGLYRVDAQARSATRLTVAGRDPSARVNALLSQGRLVWVGGVDGLWEVDTGTLRAGTRTALPATRVEGLSDPWVTAIAQGPGGSLWIGTHYGLNRFDPATRAVERILPDAHDPGALTTGWVSTMLTDPRGRLWVGTFGRGIDVLEGRGQDGRPRFHHLGFTQGLANEGVDKLLADGRGQIWASTDAGLALIDPSSFKIRNLLEAEGVAIPGYWAQSGVLTATGELVFGAAGGLTVVRPQRVKPWAYQPPVVVTDVHIGGKWVPSSHLNRSGGRGPGPLTLTPEAHSLSIEFAALDYSAPERNRYAYKLEGFDTDWTETDSMHRVAAYTNLPPGDYLLRLRGSNRDGVWTHASLTVPVRVLPAWFQTLTFKVAACLAVLFLLALAYRLRIHYVAAGLHERHRARLAERERIARDLHDTLIQSTQGLILLFQGFASDLPPAEARRASLESALDQADELLREARDRISNLRSAQVASDLPTAIRRLAEDLHTGTPFAFRFVVSGTVCPLDLAVADDVYQIAREAVTNAIRHSKGSAVEIELVFGSGELGLRVKDNGTGFGADACSASTQQRHFGLRGMQERAQRHGGELKMWSGAGAGAELAVTVPAARAYSPPLSPMSRRFWWPWRRP